MLELNHNRRAHPRFRVLRPCKIYDVRSGKYHAADTRDISRGGMLLDLPRSIGVTVDDELLIGIADKRRQPLLRTSEMVRAKVVRVVGTPRDTRAVAVRFVDPAVALPVEEQPEPLPRAA